MLGLRHYQRRKKNPESGFPTKRSVMRTALDLLIYPAAIASPLALLPQAVTLYATHAASGLVFSTWVVLGLLNLLWLVYGRVHHELPIIITNTALMAINFAIAIGILLYR
jgi:uncharacterized protein with PQ loop repeat